MKTPLRQLFLFLFGLVVVVPLSAQDCATAGRYTADIFPTVTVTSGIVFGNNSVRNYTANTNNPPQDLLLDFYEPAGDPAVKRPLIILAFGGGFISGSRTDLAPLAKAYARKGYAVAAMDYRIVTSSTDQFTLAFSGDAQKLAIVRDEIVKAAADVKAAVRFFKHDAATANTYRIDATKIFVGGASAGAIAAMQAAYVDDVNEDPNLTAAFAANGGIEGNTDLPGTPLIGTYTATGIAGVVDVAGAVLDTTVIDSNDPPIYTAQSDNDEVIPYTSGTFSVTSSGITVNIPITFYGSGSIAARATNIGLKHELYTIVGGTHETPGQSPYIENIISGSSTFLQSIVCSTFPLPVKLSLFTVRSQGCSGVVAWQTATELQSSHYDVETSADGVHFARAASITSKNAANGAQYSYNLTGTGKAVWVRLKMVDKDGAFTYSPAQRFVSQCVLSVQVFPNPAQSKATISGLVTGMQVNVLNAEGRLVWSQKAAGNILDIPVAGFAKGLLLVQVKDENGALYSSTKLMKN